MLGKPAVDQIVELHGFTLALPIMLAYVRWRRTETWDLSWPHPSLQSPIPAMHPPRANPGKGGDDVPALQSKVLESPFQALHTVSKKRARKAAARRCWQGRGDGWGECPAPALQLAGNPSPALPPQRHGQGSAPADAAPVPGDEADSSQLIWSLRNQNLFCQLPFIGL